MPRFALKRLCLGAALSAAVCLGAAGGLGAQGTAKPSPLAAAPAQEKNPLFVGSQVCADCHEEQYKSFKAHAKKARSYESVRKMLHAVTVDELKKCYECHTTGYGRPGGFVSESKTPHLAEVGCESCHGPGSIHAQSQAKKDIRSKLTAKDCESCHSAERVAAFNFKPLIYGGAH
jgi:hypothetical protein